MRAIDNDKRFVPVTVGLGGDTSNIKNKKVTHHEGVKSFRPEIEIDEDIEVKHYESFADFLADVEE